jgi:hypothetical protein
MRFRELLVSILMSAPGCWGILCDPQGTPINETDPIPANLDSELQAEHDACEMEWSACDMFCNDVYRLIHGTDLPAYNDCFVDRDPSTNAEEIRIEPVSQCSGRRPTGFRGSRPCGDVVGVFLAQQAELEHASVRAFDDLLADLIAHGAPAKLCRAVVRAAADEVRHARVCHALARRYGVTPRYASIPIAKRRTRRELAVDNASEGCVREAYGACIAAYQSRAATDPAIRRAMATIWRDEARHAELSFALHRWLAPRLDAHERRAVTDAMGAARAELHATPIDDRTLVRVAGVPTPRVARALLDRVPRDVATQS